MENNHHNTIREEDEIDLLQLINKLWRAKKSITVFTKDRQGIYAQLKGDEVKVGDKIVTGGQQNLSNGALVSVADKAGVGTEQPANKTNL